MGGITYDADSEDRRYDEAVQREIDERAATLLDAYVDGRKAGRDLSSPEMIHISPAAQRQRLGSAAGSPH
jgi:hypothetical protein